MVGGLGAQESLAPSAETADPQVALGFPDSGFACSVGLSRDPKLSEMSPMQAHALTGREREVGRKALGRSVGHPPSDNWFFSKCMEGSTGQTVIRGHTQAHEHISPEQVSQTDSSGGGPVC